MNNQALVTIKLLPTLGQSPYMKGWWIEPENPLLSWGRIKPPREHFWESIHFQRQIPMAQKNDHDRPTKMIERSHEGTRVGRNGLSCLEPCIKCETKGWRTTESPPTSASPADIGATYTLRVVGVTPLEKWLWRNSSTEPTGQCWTHCLHHEAKNLHLKANKRLVEGALEWIIVSVAYRLVLGPLWARTSRPRGDGVDRENQSRQCVVVLEANRSTSARPNLCHTRFTTWGVISIPRPPGSVSRASLSSGDLGH